MEGAPMVKKGSSKGGGEKPNTEKPQKTKQLRFKVTVMQPEAANPDLPGTRAQSPRSLKGVITRVLGVFSGGALGPTRQDPSPWGLQVPRGGPRSWPVPAERSPSVSRRKQWLPGPWSRALRLVFLARCKFAVSWCALLLVMETCFFVLMQVRNH